MKALFTPMEQSLFWESNRFSASQEIPNILWNPTVHYSIYKRPPPVPILSQIDLHHILSSQLLKIHFNIILPSSPRSSKWFFLSGFPTNSLYTNLQTESPMATILTSIKTYTLPFSDQYNTKYLL